MNLNIKSVLQLFMLSAVIVTSANVSAVDHEGIYVHLANPRAPDGSELALENEKAIKNTGLDGVFINDKWNSAEPSPGEFVWAPIDRWIKMAVERNMKISIGIGGGLKAPEWLRQPPYSVPTVDLKWDYTKDVETIPSSTKGDCSNVKAPLVWDSVYRARYIKVIESLQNHLATLKIEGYPPGAALKALTMVRVSGINTTTQELRLPMSDPDVACQAVNDQRWLDAGYSPQRLVTAWENIAEDIARIFPDQLLAVAVISGHKALPNFNAQGSPLSTDGHFDETTKTIIDLGQDRFGKRFAVQRSAIGSVDRNLFDELQSLVTVGVVGWQLNRGADKGTKCGTLGNYHECTAQEYKQVLENGISNSAEYLEVHSYDAARFPAEIFKPASGTLVGKQTNNATQAPSVAKSNKQDNKKAKEVKPTSKSKKVSEPKKAKVTEEKPKAKQPKKAKVTEEKPKAKEPKKAKATEEKPKSTEPKVAKVTEVKPKTQAPKVATATEVMPKEVEIAKVTAQKESEKNGNPKNKNNENNKKNNNKKK